MESIVFSIYKCIFYNWHLYMRHQSQGRAQFSNLSRLCSKSKKRCVSNARSVAFSRALRSIVSCSSRVRTLSGSTTPGANMMLIWGISQDNHISPDISPDRQGCASFAAATPSIVSKTPMTEVSSYSMVVNVSTYIGLTIGITCKSLFMFVAYFYFFICLYNSFVFMCPITLSTAKWCMYFSLEHTFIIIICPQQS